MSVQRSEGKPVDRLTHVEHRAEDKCIVFLDDGDRGGLQLHGYDSDNEAMVDLLVHLRALFKANGKQFAVHTIGGDG